MTNEERLKFRREAALAFTVSACDSVGLVGDDDIKYAIAQADRLIEALDG